jgi:hypothetical protein
MPDHSRLTLSEEALLKVGKNVLNLQKLEGMLKTLVTLSRVGGGPGDLLKGHKERKEEISVKTLGSLVGEYIDTVYMESPETDGDLSDDAYMSITFRMEADDASIEATREAFSKLVEERNRLIHHRLLDFDIWSEESCRLLIAELDEQHQKIAPLYRNIQGQLNTLIEVQRSAVATLQNYFAENSPDDA